MTDNDNVKTEDQRPKELTPRPLTARLKEKDTALLFFLS
jgi:hypothetical protein